MKGYHLPVHKKVQILSMLCEGSSMRSTSRVVGCSINTVTKLLLETGAKCSRYQHEHLRNLSIKQVQIDEIWAFCYGKAGNVDPSKGGDIWTWTSVDPESRLVINWRVGDRNRDECKAFCYDLASRLNGRPQITADGLPSYVQCIEAAFGDRAHFGQLVKTYADDKLSITKSSVIGNPDPQKISTSHVERQNLSMRMGMRRYTRKTNAHSKKLDNHEAALACYFFFHNMIRVNSMIKTTPAIKAGVTDKKWTWEDVLNLSS